MPRTHSPSEIRDILIGLGYLDKSASTESATKKAIEDFQKYYKMELVDGKYGPKTSAKFEEVLFGLQKNLNKVVKSTFKLDTPLYGPNTTNAVKAFQKDFLKNNNPNGIADPKVRMELDTKADIAKNLKG